MHHLVGVAEIAEMFEVTRQRVDAIIRTHPDFPEPQADLKGGRIWLRAEVARWAEQARRKGRPTG